MNTDFLHEEGVTHIVNTAKGFVFGPKYKVKMSSPDDVLEKGLGGLMDMKQDIRKLWMEVSGDCCMPETAECFWHAICTAGVISLKPCIPSAHTHAGFNIGTAAPLPKSLGLACEMNYG